MAISEIGYSLDRALDDDLLSSEEEAEIIGLRDAAGLTQADLEAAGFQERLVKGATLRDLEEGSPQNRIRLSGPSPFLLQKSERLIWMFQSVGYHEMKQKVQYVGGYAGVSVRVMKGVYLRSGGSRGERISTEHLEKADTGSLGITDKHLYFKGVVKAFRIPLKKIVSVEQFSDGIGVTKEAANPKPQIFAVDDPWFAANLLAKLS